MRQKTEAIDTSGIKISIATIVDGTPSSSIKAIGHVDSVGTIIDKSRDVKKYTPVNDTQYDEIVGMGSLTQAAFSMSVLYDPEGEEGINTLETAIDNNDQVQLIIELNNSKGTNGTTIKQICKCSSFKVDGETGGKLKSSFSAERFGKPDITPAA